eukprot:GDKI01044216.1.p2 GENE.GDKI01044216.1~~GDKI01044216.1.p2  ORF type:complete len:106 (-),score=39.36 GDKI01044216.1:14-331(-)
MKLLGATLLVALCVQGIVANPPPVATKKITEVASPAEKTCPSGYQLSGKACVREETVPASYNCPKGFIMGANKECSKKTAAPRLSKCPEGFHPGKGKECKKTVEV